MQHRKFTDIIVYGVEMDALLSYTVTFGDLFVSDMEYCVCKNGSLKKMRDYLDIRIIRLLSLSLSLSRVTRVKIQTIL